MGVYTWDNLIFTNAKVKDEVVYKMIEAMAKNKDDLSPCSRRCGPSRRRACIRNSACRIIPAR